MLNVIGIIVIMYLGTYETTAIILFPAVLLISGVVMELYLEKRREYVDSLDEAATLRQVGFYTIIALLGTFSIGAFTRYVDLPLQLMGYSALLYSILIAISEEQFFRGFIVDLFLREVPHPYLALLGSTLLFMLYHLARYGGTPDSLLYVFVGGFMLSWVAYKSRRLSPCQLGHIINNLMATLQVI